MNDLIDETPAKRSTKAPGLRTEPLRTEPVRTRKHKMGSKSEDWSYIPESLQNILRAKGLAWEYKRTHYFGKEEEPEYRRSLEENGWEALSLASIPEFRDLMSKSWSKDTVEKRGQILMVRPQYMTDEAREEEAKAASDRVKGHMAQLNRAGPNEAERTLVKVKRSYESGIPVE